MPFHQQPRDDVRRRIRFTATEPVTFADVTALLDRQIAEGSWHYGLVIDLRMAILPRADRDRVVSRMTEMSAVHGPHGPVALVTNQPDSVANAQVYAMRSTDAESVEVFWDIEEANHWLDQIPV